MLGCRLPIGYVVECFWEDEEDGIITEYSMDSAVTGIPDSAPCYKIEHKDGSFQWVFAPDINGWEIYDDAESEESAA